MDLVAKIVIRTIPEVQRLDLKFFLFIAKCNQCIRDGSGRGSR